eukprot:UN12849
MPLKHKITKLWRENIGWEYKRYTRVIFIVDRRNPKHLANHEMFDDTNKEQTWPDTMYLICPKSYNKIPSHYEYKLNECFAINTKEYLLPIADEVDFGGLDSGNGYKFVVSYHVHFKDNVKLYWYLNSAVQRFFIHDIAWLWPRFFNRDIGALQCLSNMSQYEL